MERETDTRTDEDGEVGLSARPEKRKVEFIESYWTGGELGSDYQWNDNHGELVRCKDCKHWTKALGGQCNVLTVNGCAHCTSPDWFCGDGKRKEQK